MEILSEINLIYVWMDGICDWQDTAKNVQLTVLTDRSQGGASIHDGEIELMVCSRFLFL